MVVVIMIECLDNLSKNSNFPSWFAHFQGSSARNCAKNEDFFMLAIFTAAAAAAITPAARVIKKRAEKKSPCKFKI